VDFAVESLAMMAGTAAAAETGVGTARLIIDLDGHHPHQHSPAQAASASPSSAERQVLITRRPQTGIEGEPRRGLLVLGLGEQIPLRRRPRMVSCLFDKFRSGTTFRKFGNGAHYVC